MLLNIINLLLDGLIQWKDRKGKILDMLKILNFINKIKEIFIKFFKNKNSLMLTDGIENNEIDIVKDENMNDNLISSFSYEQQDKNDFLIMYKNVKNGIIKLDELLFTDMIRVQLMMQEEIGILDYKAKSIENNIENLKVQKGILAKEEQYYKLKNTKKEN